MPSADTNGGGVAPPKRRWQLALTLHADTLDDALSELRCIANDAELDGLPMERTSGGSHTGYHLTVVEDESITAESYEEALHAFIAHRRALPDAAPS